jgi:hypothetical protein
MDLETKKMIVRPTSQPIQSLLTLGGGSNGYDIFSLQMQTDIAARLAKCWNSYDQNQQTIKDLVEACVKAHDGLLALHICNQDQTFANELRNMLKSALSAARGEK